MKTVALATVVLGSLTLAPGLAGADQCAYVVPGQAQDAVQLLEVGKDIITFCEPCGDTAPQRVRVESFTAADTGFEGFWEVSVNGAGIDLAYTFIENGDGRWINLAEMVDCETDGVSCMLGADLAPAGCNEGKEDGAEDEDDASGCHIAGRGGPGGTWLLGLALLGLALVRRR